ncbi:hypothetical protein CVIRNUC_005018 [Coccomyxa viridis]|uniref:Activator of Hsp90 ATPase AHSA1-like N-terminal domain-containing protein n=1 Tax=Coccomyxa viridis TaxID=1274662 RepID=A0AAV1I5S7_9CHLO|nr:hypothetical protein CVIRNUC_005018 [Coccomyxa viridis]
MAKAGEGDERWIVDDLGSQGTNVNSWHWQEKDVLPWAKQRLQELLGSLTVRDDNSGSTLSTGSSVSVTGDAIINNRKRKLIPSYELEVKGTWKGSTKDGSSAEGTFTMPYIADENADEDPELKAAVMDDSKSAQQLRELFLSQGRQLVHERVRGFVKEVQAGGPSARRLQEEPPGNGAAAEAPGAGSQAAAAFREEELARQKAAAAAAKKVAEEKQRAQDRAPTATIELSERFYARPGDLYECFTNPGRVQAFSQSPAQVEPRVGGTFSIYGGSVEAKFTTLEPPSKIGMDWRFKNWPDNTTSKVTITLEEVQDGVTVLKLIQKGIPKEDRYGNSEIVDNTTHGWKNQIFHRIRAVFGFGL